MLGSLCDIKQKQDKRGGRGGMKRARPCLRNIEDLLAGGAVKAGWPGRNQPHIPRAASTFAQHLACTANQRLLAFKAQSDSIISWADVNMCMLPCPWEDLQKFAAVVDVVCGNTTFTGLPVRQHALAANEKVPAFTKHRAKKGLPQSEEIMPLTVNQAFVMRDATAVLFGAII